MANLLEKVISGLSGIGDESLKTGKKNLNEKIANAAKEAFSNSIKENSLHKEKMMFERTVIINLHPDDYEKSCTFFYGLNDIIINRFYDVINQHLRYYNNNYDKSFKGGWMLKYLLMEQTKKGNPTATTENPTIIREKTLKDNEKEANSKNFSVGPTVSVFDNKGRAINIKTEVFLNCQEREDGIFEIRFDESRITADANLVKKKWQFIDQKTSNDSSKGFAKFTYDLSNGKGLQIHYMETDQIEICGKNDNRKKKEINVERCIIDLDLSPARYVKIFLENQKFLIAHYGKSTLNNTEIQMRTDGKINRYSLPNNSTIRLYTVSGKEVSIKFESLI